ncbi:hypothetical protein SAMN05216167_101782 [Spirosoma endophyticum]|uniref:Uncharacterized protein n=1 Tax=Spirosoma endophyticum TaxID=662367 RepID=A0A1I1HTL5_9BACT|nr:hypothetical protein SAMN05216167_101782 [Spirosoma endophyticum]
METVESHLHTWPVELSTLTLGRAACRWRPVLLLFEKPSLNFKYEINANTTVFGYFFDGEFATL